MTNYYFTNDTEISPRHLHLEGVTEEEIKVLFKADEPFLADVYPSAHGFNPGFVDVYFADGKVTFGLPENSVKRVD